MGKFRLLMLKLMLRGSWIVLNDAKNDGTCETQLHTRGRAQALAMLTGSIIDLMRRTGTSKEQAVKMLSDCVEIQYEEGKEA